MMVRLTQMLFNVRLRQEQTMSLPLDLVLLNLWDKTRNFDLLCKADLYDQQTWERK